MFHDSTTTPKTRAAPEFAALVCAEDSSRPQVIAKTLAANFFEGHADFQKGFQPFGDGSLRTLKLAVFPRSEGISV